MDGAGAPPVGGHLYRPERAAGRPLCCDPRARFEAMPRAAVADTPLHKLPDGRAGRGTTVGRHFSRLAHAGLWSRLLEAVADPHAPPLLRHMEYWVCSLARRAMRVLEMRGLDLARRLGPISAMPMCPHHLPDRDLSEIAHALAGQAVRMVGGALDTGRLDWTPPTGLLTRLGKLMALAGGRRVWSERLAPA